MNVGIVKNSQLHLLELKMNYMPYTQSGRIGSALATEIRGVHLHSASGAHGVVRCNE